MIYLCKIVGILCRYVIYKLYFVLYYPPPALFFFTLALWKNRLVPSLTTYYRLSNVTVGGEKSFSSHILATISLLFSKHLLLGIMSFSHAVTCDCNLSKNSIPVSIWGLMRGILSSWHLTLKKLALFSRYFTVHTRANWVFFYSKADKKNYTGIIKKAKAEFTL